MEPENSLPHLQKPATCRLSLARSIPLHALTSHLLKIHLNIILKFTSGSPMWSLSLRFSHQNLVYISALLHSATCPAHLLLLDLITRIMFGEEDRSLSTSLCSLLHSPVSSSLSGPHVLLSTLFSNTPSLRSSLSVSDHVSHPYKTSGNVTVLVVFILIFSDRKLKNKKFCTE